VGTAIFSFTKIAEMVFEGGINKFWRRRKMERKLQPKIADREFHGERSVVISIIHKEIATHVSGASNDLGMMTFSLLSAIWAYN
jgi:hypothetical protein